MNIEELEKKWNELKPESTGSFKSLRISAECIPDIYIGSDVQGIRCLILKIPPSHFIDFQSVIKQNLSIELFKDTHWIILKLTNSIYSDLFNDLILSLYGKIRSIAIVKEYLSLFIETFYKWTEFFEENITNRLSEEAVMGVFGELTFLNNIIPQKEPVQINEILMAWKGPYDTGHDFIFKGENIEVKTKERDALDVCISSEYQLEPETGKPLRLIVINVLKVNTGLSLSDLVTSLRKLVIDRLGEFTIFLKALAQKGITLSNISTYDNVKYTPISITLYDCMNPQFPKIVKSQLPDQINSVKYNVRISSLDNFIVDKKDL